MTETTSSQRNLSTCLLAGGAILGILAQVTQVAQIFDIERTMVVVLLFIGLTIYLLGILSAKKEGFGERMERILKHPANWLGLEPWQAAAIFLALLFSILAHFAAGPDLKMISPTAAWGAWIAGIVFCFIGCWKFGEFSFQSYKKAFIIAGAFVLLALPFRIIATSQIPIILNGDEASAGIYGMQILDGEADNPFSAGWYAFPGLYFLIPASSISLFGNTTAALRIPSAIAGALTVGGMYLLGQTMFDKRTGILAALALTGFHFHIHFSRIGLNNIWDGLFFVLTVCAAWYGWSREKRAGYVLAGLGLGLSQYFYPSSRVLLGVVFGGIILTGLFDFARLKKSLPDLIVMMLIAVVIYLPLGWYYLQHPEQFLAPLNRVSILGSWMENEVIITGLPAWQIILKQLWLGVQSFTYLDLKHWYRPEVPLLRPAFAGIFLLGLVHLISRPKDGRSITLFIWLLMYVLLGGLSESTPAAQRYVAAAPACMLIIAHGLHQTANLIEKMWRGSNRFMSYVAIGVVVVLAASDAYFYFFKYTPMTVQEFGHNNGVVAQAIADEIIDEPEGTQAFFFVRGDMGYYSIPSIIYLVPQVDGFDVHEPWGSPENPIATASNLLFIFLPDGAEDLPAIQESFPGGTLHEPLGADGLPLYLLYKYTANQ